MSLSPISSSSLEWPEFTNKVQLQMYVEPCSPEVIVNQLSSIEGAVDVYFWYEGAQCLPTAGALFMKEEFLKPLYQLKRDAKLYLYSLRAWDFKKIPTPSTTLGEKINSINKTALECIYSSSFFQYCKNPQDNNLYAFLSEELPKKEWLFALSASHRKVGKTVSAFFDNQASLFDCIKDLDLSLAYSAMQYVEGYYLIQESIKRAVAQGQKKVNIALVLPNDESKYYEDLLNDIKKMLPEEFADIEINISFRFFRYGDSLASRPYIKQRGAPQVKPSEIASYFNYLSSQATERRPRDEIHNLNGWYA